MREVLMITNRNSDLHKINAETRMVLIKKGFLAQRAQKSKSILATIVTTKSV